MLIYIDFDSTIFHTKNFFNYTVSMIAKECAKFCKIDDDNKFLSDIQNLYKTNKVKNIFTLCAWLEKQYDIKSGKLKKVAEKAMLKAEDFVFLDVIPFFNNLKNVGHKIILFTYSANSGFDYQLLKIRYSGISNYLDDILITCQDKSSLSLDYKNGIFIDDNPDVLRGLINNNAKRVIRICRDGCKYSNEVLDFNVEEVSSLSEILI